MKKCVAGRNQRSLYKLAVHGETDQVVGVHMYRPRRHLCAAIPAVRAKLKKLDFPACNFTRQWPEELASALIEGLRGSGTTTHARLRV